MLHVLVFLTRGLHIAKADELKWSISGVHVNVSKKSTFCNQSYQNGRQLSPTWVGAKFFLRNTTCKFLGFFTIDFSSLVLNSFNFGHQNVLFACCYEKIITSLLYTLPKYTIFGPMGLPQAFFSWRNLYYLSTMLQNFNVFIAKKMWTFAAVKWERKRTTHQSGNIENFYVRNPINFPWFRTMFTSYVTIQINQNPVTSSVININVHRWIKHPGSGSAANHTGSFQNMLIQK